MNKVKKLSLVILTILSIQITNSTMANAYWKQNSQGWQFTKGEAYSVGWDKIDGNWYYFDSDGIMETGWINDNNKWYYLNDSGAWEESKTTTVVPNDIQVMYDIINIYNDSGTIKYENKGFINQIGLSDKSLYKFSAEDQVGNNISEYYYDSSNGNVYKIKQGITTLLNSNVTINNTNIQISTIEAVEKVKDYLLANGKYVPSKVEYDHDESNSYVIHCYDTTGEYVTTGGWYYVDNFTGNVTSMF